MPFVNQAAFEEIRRHQQITKYEIYPLQSADIEDYQVLAEDIPSLISEDVRILQKKAKIPFWAEGKGKAWSKIAKLMSKTPQKLFALSGNPSAISASNIMDSFVLGDDFESYGGWEKTTWGNATKIGLYEDSNPIIACSAASTDKYIRESGNVLYEPGEASRKYKIFYTGYNAGKNTDEKIHYAYSEDGKTWTKSTSNPVINDRRAEDPYVVKNGSTYYLYAEDKQGATPQEDIRRWHSDDCETWIDDGVVMTFNNSLGEYLGVSSPVVWIEDSTWYMIYESWSVDSWAQIYLATSADGISWTREATNPIIEHDEISGAIGCVPDDIIKKGSLYYLFSHAKVDGGAYKGAISYSTILTSWNHQIWPIGSDESGVDYITSLMAFYDTEDVLTYDPRNGFDTQGIFRGYPIRVVGNDLSDNWTLAGDVTVSTEHARNEQSMKLNGLPSNTITAKRTLLHNSNIIHWEVHYTKGDSYGHQFYHGNDTNLMNFGFADNIGANNFFYKNDAGAQALCSAANGWHTVEARNINWVAATYDIWLDGEKKKEGAEMRTNAAYDDEIVFYEKSQIAYCDNIFVRKDISPEPLILQKQISGKADAIRAVVG